MSVRVALNDSKELASEPKVIVDFSGSNGSLWSLKNPMKKVSFFVKFCVTL